MTESLAAIRDRLLEQMPKREIARAAVLERPVELDSEHAVMIDHPNGHTTITVPARAKAAQDAERWLLRIQGKFVGADVPNRNGAMWTAEDLLYGQPTVAMGPLNWLHNEKKIVGCITESTYHERQVAAGVTTAPHLTASSIMWKWLYPQEALIAERAADNNALWYSMECIAENVECRPTPGGPGCGAKFSYETYMRQRASTCEHIRSGTAPRRFENPVFQGGAIIVPPIRPGWAEADADVVRQAAMEAEMLDPANFQLDEPALRSMLAQVAAWQKP